MLSGYTITPLPVLTLPPADAINTVVLGDAWVVDPGSDEPLPLACAPKGIILTHRHRDHTAGANALRERYGCPVLAHPITANELAGRVQVDRLLNEGDTLEFGPHLVRVLHTPGHALGHIVLHEEARGVMVVGDMVAGVGSIVIAAPDGNVRHYLASLERLRALQPRVLIPAHGPVIDNAVDKLSEYIAHRLKREAMVLAAVQQGATTLQDIVSIVYAGTPPFILPWAERAAETHLDKLVEDGAVHRDGDFYRL